METRTGTQSGAVRETTQFLWQGLRLLQERGGNECQTFIYDPVSPYTPVALARHFADSPETLPSASLYYYHTELNGAPLDVTDEEGHTVWSGESLGAVKRQTLTWLMRDVRKRG